MIIGIEFSRMTIDVIGGKKSYFRIAPYIAGVKPRNAETVKILVLGALLFTVVVAIGKAFAV